jgi:hypothetical protein
VSFWLRAQSKALTYCLRLIKNKKLLLRQKSISLKIFGKHFHKEILKEINNAFASPFFVFIYSFFTFYLD